MQSALEMIRKCEKSFDRGYYSGPFGCIGCDYADLFVSIRGALVTNCIAQLPNQRYVFLLLHKFTTAEHIAFNISLHAKISC